MVIVVEIIAFVSISVSILKIIDGLLHTFIKDERFNSVLHISKFIFHVFRNKVYLEIQNIQKAKTIKSLNYSEIKLIDV